jgi:hypothetical protein
VTGDNYTNRNFRNLLRGMHLEVISSGIPIE